MSSSVDAITTAFNAMVLSSVLTEFTPFPKLPTELRLMIWKRAVPYARVLHLSAPEKGSTVYTDEKGNEKECTGLLELVLLRPVNIPYSEYTKRYVIKSCFGITSPGDAILAANWESRETALKLWPKSIRIQGFSRHVHFGPHDAIQIDGLDAVLTEMRCAGMFGLRYGSILDNVHTLCVDVKTFFTFIGIPGVSGDDHDLHCLNVRCLNLSGRPFRVLKNVKLLCNESQEPVEDLEKWMPGPHSMEDLTLFQKQLFQKASTIADPIASKIASAHVISRHNDGDPKLVESDCLPTIEILARGWPELAPSVESTAALPAS